MVKMRNVGGPNPEKVEAPRAWPEGWGPEEWEPKLREPRGVGPRRVGPRPRKSCGPEGWGLKGGGPKGVGPKAGFPKFRVFSLSPFSLFFSLSGGLLVEFWWCLVRRDPQMCTFGGLWLSCEAWVAPGRRGSGGGVGGVQYHPTSAVLKVSPAEQG